MSILPTEGNCRSTLQCVLLKFLSQFFNFILDNINNLDAAKDLKLLEDCVFDENIFKKWENTFEIRKDLLQSEISTTEYLKRFPVLEQADGYKLV